MSSQRRIQASRANGAKSHGPVTPEGKRRSSSNSQKHGPYSHTIVLDDEDAESFHKLLASMERSFCPQNDFQADCILHMAVARWRTLRAWAMEHSTLQSEIRKQDDPGLTPPARAALAFRSIAERSNALEILGRYEARFDRQYTRAYNNLLKDKKTVKFENEPSSNNGQFEPNN